MADDSPQGDATRLVAAPDKKLVSGWGVFRRQPYDFVGIFTTREDADKELARAGSDYEVGFGTARIGSNEFRMADDRPEGSQPDDQ